MKRLMIAVVAACAAVGATAGYTPTWRGLPKGYTQVEYVESSGTQYIDLGITAQSGLSMETDMLWTELPSEGGYCAALNANRWVMPLFYDNSGWVFGLVNFFKPKVKANVNTLYHAESTLCNGLQDIVITDEGGKVVLSQTNTTATGDFSLDITLYLFALHSGASVVDKVKARCYTLKLWLDDKNGGRNLVGDFVPCLNASGDAGLYDLVGNQFLSPSGELAGYGEPVLPDNGIFVTGTPEPFADNGLPVYGLFEKTVGDPVELAAPETAPVAESIRAACTGWKLYDINGEKLDESTAMNRLLCSFTYTKLVKLVWQWKTEALVKVNFDSSRGSVTANGASIASGWEKWTEVGAGGTVTLTATAGDGAFFKGWTGAPDGVDPRSATITLPADSVATVTAEFILPIWVATDGNDDTGDGGGSAPFATIAKGIEAAKAKIAAGAEDATVCIKDGSYASPFATLDGAIAVIGNVARPSKVVITDETPGNRAFELTHEGAKVAGVKITGKGLQASNGSGGHILMSAGTVEDSIIENGFAGQTKTSGWGGNVHMTGGTLRRCRVRNGQTTDLANDGYGYGGNISVGAGSACLIENCLVTGGKVNSVYSAAGIGIQKNTSTKVVNCTIVGNTGVVNGYGGIHTVPSQTRVIGCVIYGNGGTAKAEWGNANAGSFINCATSADAAFTGGTDNINTVTDAAFLNYANGKYRPREDGVLVGKGLVWEDYLLHATSRTDLSGRPRGKSTNPVDIGCYSVNGNGLAIFVR